MYRENVITEQRKLSVFIVQMKDVWSHHKLPWSPWWRRNLLMNADNSNCDWASVMLCSCVGVADDINLVNWQLQLLQYRHHFPLSVTCWWWVVVTMDCTHGCTLGYQFISYFLKFNTLYVYLIRSDCALADHCSQVQIIYTFLLTLMIKRWTLTKLDTSTMWLRHWHDLIINILTCYWWKEMGVK